MNMNLKIFTLLLFAFNNVYSQTSFFEINGGVNNSNFYTITSSEDYTNTLTSYNNAIFSAFYIKKINNKSFWEIGLEKTDYKSGAEINYRVGRSSYFHNVSYEMEYLNLHLALKRNLFQMGKFTFSLNTSVFLGYLVKSYEKGNGWYLKYVVEEDPDGDGFSYFIRENWDINTRRTENINKYNLGISGGLILDRQISELFSINVNVNYSVSILQTLVFANAPYNGIRNFNINVGVTYVLKNNEK